MALEERSRHDLHVGLAEVQGADRASTLMSYLPPVGWTDVATKRDLDHLADRLRGEFHREIGALRSDLHTTISSQTRTYFFGVLASNATLAAVAFAAARLA